MPLAIKPPQLPTCDFQPQLNNVQQLSTTADSIQKREASPGAPEYSPITPKVHPAIPAIPAVIEQPAAKTTVDSSTQQSSAQQNGETSTKTIAPTELVPAPPSQPFSSDESIDGLALRAAISSLQFQRQQARDDIRSLEEIRNRLLADPERFTQELVAGRVKEKRHDFGSAQDVLDARGGAELDGVDNETPVNGSPSLRTLPGPQNVVRMPHINWDKYNIMGEPLDVMHEQLRRHPGTAPFQPNKGREFSVAAPYSPWQDTIDEQHNKTSPEADRKDNAPTTNATSNEHPYETRRNSKPSAQ
ncbi:hypothetical protein AMS68_003671 [Peltaster fructicola]|uniref:Uncharacterized protein n=1 Tax=Peltaster fructicola TaxID=286661 RepID=A0A6H0XTU0_9PEZI|nr:hypothetical protein AMS68_003671 [Peltaster fructicola]